jgi:hypothetical protein
VTIEDEATTKALVRDAMSAHDPAWTIDSAAALAAGRQQVRRRRILAGTGVVATVAAVGTVLPLALTGGTSARVQVRVPAAATGPAPSKSADDACVQRITAIKQQVVDGKLSKQQGTAACADVPTSPPPPPATVIGDMITTGKHNAKGAQALYFTAINDAQLPGITFGMMEGNVAGDGTHRDCYETNEFAAGSLMAPGFHAMSFDQGVDCGWTNTFGYVVGAVDHVTAVVNGQTVAGHVAAWSHDPSVKAFWVNGRGTAFTAYDAAGNAVATSGQSARVG